jgi:RNA polymerase sigma factor (TIGR02999 family)
MNSCDPFRVSVAEREPSTTDHLLPQVYEDLMQLARAQLLGEYRAYTVDATILVHEAYLRLVSNKHGQNLAHVPRWDSRGHFFAAAAESMRRILIDWARQRHSQRRGGHHVRLELVDEVCVAFPMSDELLDITDAVTRLAKVDPQVATVVKLHVYGGMTFDEVAAALTISPRTAKRHWTYARVWLRAELYDGAERQKS